MLTLDDSLLNAGDSAFSWVTCSDDGEGIHSIRLTAGADGNTLTREVIARLVRAIDDAGRCASLKVLMLQGTADAFARGGRTHCNEALTQALYQKLAGFPYPVIAVMQGDALGAGFLLGALCDFMVCSETANYRYTDPESGLFPSAGEDRLFNLRFGRPQASDFLQGSGAGTGRQLKDRHWSCPILSAAEVEPHARRLASALATRSRDNLRLLKQHLARDVLESATALRAMVASPLVTLDGAVESPALPAGEHVETAVHADNILLLRLRERTKTVETTAITAELAALFDGIGENSPYRAIVLASDFPEFLPEGGDKALPRAVSDLHRVLLNAPLPVIAVMNRQVSGSGWLVAQACDRAVYQSDGRYEAGSLLQGAELAGLAAHLFSCRLGGNAAREILLSGAAYSGEALRRLAGAVQVAAEGEGIALALRLAASWAAWPLSTIKAWKTHSARELGQGIESLGTGIEPRADGEACSIDAPTRVALSSKVVSVTAHPGGIVEVAMHDRESKNMFSEAFIRGMEEAFAHIDATEGYKVAILTGYDNYFASGGTREALLAIQQGRLKFTDDRTFKLALTCRIPVIAAMQGHAIGAGLSLALFADLPLLSTESKYVSPYMDYGFTPGVGATLVVPQRWGLDLAREALLTARDCDGGELEARALPLPVHARKHLPEAAMRLAKRIAQHPRAGLVRIKQHLNRDVRERLDDTCERELAMHEQSFVGRSDPLKRIEAVFERNDSEQPRAMAESPACAASAPPATGCDVAALPEIAQTLKSLLAQELHLEEHEVDENTQYVDLGLDSITGVTWIRKINQQYGLSLDATIVYGFPTLTGLARHVKSLVENRDMASGVPDLAEIEARKVGREAAASARPIVPGIVLDPIAPDEPAAPAPQPAPAREVESLSEVVATLKCLLARELHLEEHELDEHTQYTDLGLDSITGVTWMRKVNERYGLSLDATIAYSHPTLTRLARHVREVAERRDMTGAMPDFAELETRKLGAARAARADVVVPRIALGDLAAEPAAARPEASPRQSAPVRELVSWRKQARDAAPVRAQEAAVREHSSEAIAVIGMAGQFPRARNIDEFWRNLAEGRDCISEIPPGRWDLESWFQAGEPVQGKTNSKWMGLLEDHDRFDPLFFNISPAEAKAMDPQQRVFLQACWQCIEHAGYNPKALGGSRCGVFVGGAANDYGLLSRKMQLSAHGFTGNASSILSARIAYFLDLQGPCLAIDTACSSSLVAIASACDALASGASELALAGGVYVSAGPAMHIMTAQSGMLSTDGRCFSFDHRANGFVPGEAVGVVMLKRLSDAERDGDIVHAVIRGWGVNQDGRTNGITAPNPQSQAQLMRDVYRRFGIDAAEIQLIEAHGTGTALGDPIEIEGLKKAFHSPARKGDSCALGSVKSNIGHCLTAAGITAFIKTVLALQHKQLPPTINFERLNEHIQLAGTPFYVNDRLRDWTVQGAARRQAAVSSFGFSGTNAHVVVAEYAQPQRKASSRDADAPLIVPISAKSSEQLGQRARDLLDFLRGHGRSSDLADMAYTLQVGREAMDLRVAFLVDSTQQLADRLAAFVDGEPRIADAFQGQASLGKEGLSLVNQDEELRDSIIDSWIAQRKFAKLAKLWAKGLEFDWNKLHRATKPRRIVMPVYPFAQERYWIDDPDHVPDRVTVPGGAAPLAAPPVAAERAQRLFFEEFWQEQPSAAREPASHERRTIVLADAGCDWVPGATLVADRSVDIADILRQVGRETPHPVALVHAWAMGRRDAGIHAVFDLFKAIKATATRVSHVVLVGRDDPSQRDSAWDLAWVGFERSVKHVLPDVKLTLLYTDAPSCTREQVVDALGCSGVIRYRGGKRSVLSIRPVEAGQTLPVPAVKQQGAYVITGGCGALGMKFAHHLARDYRARLFLLGRRPLSAKIQRQLDDLRRAGACDVQYAALDIADADALALWARGLSVPLSGVFHAAGVDVGRPFFEKSAAEIDAVLRPKIAGTVALDDALQDQPLDFVCYFSSSAAVLGDFGSCDYAIANRFQMAWGEYRWRDGCCPGKTVVINWPFWNKEAGQTGGMGSNDPAQLAFYLKSSGQEALDSTEGLRTWQQLMHADRPQTLVMLGQPTRITQSLQRLYRGEAPAVAAPASMPRPQPAASEAGPVALPERLRRDLRQLAATSLEMDPARLNDRTSLADYGFDSISLSAFAKRLSSHFALEVTPAWFFHHSTIEQLVEHFVAEHRAHLETLFADTGTATAADQAADPAVAPAAADPAHTGARAPAAAAAGMRTSQAARGAEDLIAVVGMSGRFPRANNVDELWTLLAQGRSGIGEIPRARWNWRDYFTAPGHIGNVISTNRGGFIDGVDEFDPLFFEVSPAEAEEMDPSERILLMEAYRAVEDARISPATLRGRNIGVFVGMEESQYGLITEVPGVTTIGAAMISSRLSYFLDLHGPTIATNTACSSGLVALHQAIASLRLGECESALVAGVSLSLSPKAWIKMSEARMISPDGQCFTFSKKANGIGVGEAVVVLMLKPLSAAIADGDPVRGIVRASGINFDGKTNGVTAPNGRMQARLIEDIYAANGIDIRDVAHIVSHGTGTKLGDPVEITALNQAFKTLGRQQGSTAAHEARCALTSCKSNLGHTMAASGLVSLVALLKGMEHGKIPASLHCEEENDYIDWRDSPFYVNKTTRDWPAGGGRRRMGAVSAFGRSGTNAHVVIEQYRPAAPSRPRGGAVHGPALVPLSARALPQLQQKARDLLALIGHPERPELAEIAYSLQVTREPMEVRAAFVVGSIEQLARELEAYLAGSSASGNVFEGTARHTSAAAVEGGIADAVERCIAARDLHRLARCWSEGYEPDWNRLYGEQRPQRVALPAYPFAKERHWIDAAPSLYDEEEDAASQDEPGGDIESIEDMLDRIDAGSIEMHQAAAFLKKIAD